MRIERNEIHPLFRKKEKMDEQKNERKGERKKNSRVHPSSQHNALYAASTYK